MKVFTPDGEEHGTFTYQTYVCSRMTPPFLLHLTIYKYEENLDWYNQVCEVTKPPPKINSPITVLSYAKFNKMSVSEAQDIFAGKIIVVQDHPHHLEFNLEGLVQFGDLDELRTMHGISFSCFMYLMLSTRSRSLKRHPKWAKQRSRPGFPSTTPRNL